MEDFDVEAMLEAPYNKNIKPDTKLRPGRAQLVLNRTFEKKKSSDEDDSHAKDDRYSNGSNERRTRKHERNSRDDDDNEFSKRKPHKTDRDNTSPLEKSSKSRKREGSITDKDAGRKHRTRSRSGSRDDRRKRRTSKDRERQDKDRERQDKDRVRFRSREKERDRNEEGRRHKDEEPRKSRDPDRRDREKPRSRSRDSRRRSRDRRPRSGSRDHRTDRPHPDRRRSRSRGERRPSPVTERSVRSKSGKRSRSKEKTNHRRSFSPRPFRRVRTPPNGLGDRSPLTEMSPEERDARTVFCMQLSQRVRARDLEEFFSSVGKVRDVRLITCNKTKRFKGIAYIEFRDPESVALALGLSGQRLLGIPISVQHTQAEKNRMASVPAFVPKKHTGPMRLYVGSLHFNITEEMLRGIFEPFGKIDSIQLIMDSDTGRSKGYGFITYHNADDAKKALEQLNGFELAGRPMKVGNVTERLDMNTASLDTDEMDRSGIDLGATGRLQLMFKLAEGAGLAVPQAAANALLATAPQPPPAAHTQTQTPPIATQCFMLSNMFDPRTETNPAWDVEIRDDVIEECSKHGGVLHIHVDKGSLTGNVYVKCPSITTAVLAVNSLHGRWFAGRVIAAAYVPLLNYHSLFPDAITAVNLLATTRKPTDD